MRFTNKATIALLLALALLTLVACSKSAAPSSSTSPSSQSEPAPPPSSNDNSSSGASSALTEDREYFTDLSAEDEALYQVLTKERGLQEWQIHSLSSHGFSFENMLDLTGDDIAELLAPGGTYMGDYMEEEEINSLIDGGMSEDDVMVLRKRL